MLAFGRGVGLRLRRREARAEVAALAVERGEVALGEALYEGARVVVVEDAAGLLYERLFAQGARALTAHLAYAQARPLDAEEVLDLSRPRVFREVVDDRALYLSLAQ